MTLKRIFLFLIFSLFICSAFSQTGEIRGFVYDKETGEPIMFTNVVLKETKVGAQTDINGFFTISKIKEGSYTLFCTFIGYDTLQAKIDVKSGKIINKNIYLKQISIELGDVEINAERQKKKETPNVSVYKITPRELKMLPSIGGEPDLAQYLQILPGVVFSGDQGGQLYIRGGSPVMNKVLLDGMIIYNPFHSIGLFTVFDADILRSTEVHSAGFNSQYGGRVSAIVDVNTRDGNKINTGGKLTVNPFSSKLLLEGPLKKFKEGQGSISYLASYKNSYLNRTAPIFYNYVKNGLPYSFEDTYGKLSINAANGSRVNFFGFNFRDNVNFKSQTSYNWKSTGFATNFLLVPDGSNTILNGVIAYSDYLIKQQELDNKPRRSGVTGYNANLIFTSYKGKDEIKYGIELNSFRTDFEIYNSNNRRIQDFNNSTELGGFFKYRLVKPKLVFEPGIRTMVYASLGETTLEPRYGLKYIVNERIRLKSSGGFYSQNLMSAVSDRDVVNLFYGFLSAPDDLPKTFDGNEVKSRLQKARHIVGGIEYDINSYSDLNFELFYKNFNQITNINRDKIFDDNAQNAWRPEYQRLDYIVERGKAYGGDISYKYDRKNLYLWAVYSLVFVTRYDGIRNYVPHFDRRHTVNLLGTYKFGKKLNNDFSLRWSLGSGFPFTLTQGMFENLNFDQGISFDYTKANGQLGIIYGDLNTGRLPYFHRMDASFTHNIKFNKRSEMNLIASVTNVYNRENIFYFDRVSYTRINQLPIMPSIGMNVTF